MAVDLQSNLIAYWALENLTDSKGTISDLTNNASVTFIAGKILNAAHFVAASNQYLSHASEANLQTGDIAWTFNFWVKLTDKVANSPFLYKGDALNSTFEWIFYYDQASDRFINNTTGTAVTANNFGSPTVGVWYMITVQHASAGGAITIQVNAGTANSTAGVTGTSNASELKIGNDGLGADLNGDLYEIGFWKRALNAQEISALYNGGRGLAYPLLAADFHGAMI